MSLGQISHGAAPLGSSACSYLEWQAKGGKPVEERPACRVHRRRVTQGLLGQRLKLRMTELGGGARAFGVVTGPPLFLRPAWPCGA